MPTSSDAANEDFERTVRVARVRELAPIGRSGWKLFIPGRREERVRCAAVERALDDSRIRSTGDERETPAVRRHGRVRLRSRARCVSGPLTSCRDESPKPQSSGTLVVQTLLRSSDVLKNTRSRVTVTTFCS